MPNLAECALWGDFSITSLLREILGIDILQFAGLTMLLWGVIVYLKLNMNIKALLSISIILGAGNMLLQELDIWFELKQEMLPAAVSGLFFGSSKMAEFPLLTWIAYPIFGAIYGIALKNNTNKSFFYRNTLIGSLIVFGVLNLLYCYFDIEYLCLDDMPYYHHNLFQNIIFSTMIVSWIALLYYVSKITPQVIKNTAQRWSVNIALIYVIHWILIGWITVFLPDEGLGIWGYLIGATALFIISDFIAQLLSKKGIRLF